MPRNFTEIPGWSGRNCKDEPKNTFFPDTEAGSDAAKRVCAGCPVKQPCFEVALENKERGIWGGTSERERRRIARRRRLEKAHDPISKP